MLSIITRWTDRERYLKVQEGQRMPPWQGVVMYDAPTRSTLLAPIPLNWLIAWAWHLHGKLQAGWRRQELYWAYDLGRQDETASIAKRGIMARIESMIKEQVGR